MPRTIYSRKIDARHAEIRVSDTGRGLPLSNGDILVASVARSAKGGLGLGVALSRTLVEAHGRMLWADNNLDVGASVHFTLPVATELDMAPDVRAAEGPAETSLGQAISSAR